MRILINAITTNDTIRGVERHIIELTRGLSQIDRENQYVIFIAPWQNYFPHIFQENFRFITVNIPRNQTFRNMWQAFVFPFVARKIKPDIVHLSNVMPLVIKMYPTIVTLHDLIESYYPKSFNKLQVVYRKIILHVITRLSSCIITVSNYVKATILERCKKARIVTIYNGVSYLRENSSNSTKNNDVLLPNKYILFVGVFEPHKNVVSIIKAFSRISHKIKEEYKLVFVGREGRDSKNISEHIEQLKLKKKILHLSKVDDQTLAQIYEKASLFVFPSFIEGFGLPVLEAMAVGTPVIASNKTALPEVCGDAAILVNPDSVEELANAIEEVLTNKSLTEELVKKGKERLKLFSWDRAAKETLELYNRVYYKDKRFSTVLRI